MIAGDLLRNLIRSRRHGAGCLCLCFCLSEGTGAREGPPIPGCLGTTALASRRRFSFWQARVTLKTKGVGRQKQWGMGLEMVVLLLEMIVVVVEQYILQQYIPSLPRAL